MTSKRPMAMTVDDLVTAITEAPTPGAAYDILSLISRALLNRIADQLYVEFEGRRSTVVRHEIITEARS